MGFFGEFLYANGSWGAESATEPYVAIQIDDSDIARIDYAPSPDTVGRCYLGFEPRHYYDDPSESEPVDTAAEARGLVAWAGRVTGAAADPADIEAMLARADGTDPVDDFVEETVVRLLNAINLPVPEDLAGN